MDKLARYREYLKSILDEYAYAPSYGQAEVEKIIDPSNDHYQLMTVGWHDQQRIHGSILHMDIRNGQIWIQHDGTEEGVATRLVEMGVPKEDIVLAFHSPFRRRFTGYGTGENSSLPKEPSSA